MKKGGITRSTGFQIFLYFLLAAGFLCCFFCTKVGIWLWVRGGFDESYTEYEENIMASEVYAHLDYICGDDYSFPTLADVREAFERESTRYNLKFAIYKVENDFLIWSNYSTASLRSPYVYEVEFQRTVEYENMPYIVHGENYRAVCYVEQSFAKDDVFRQLHENARFWYDKKEFACWGAVAGGLLAALAFVWILCNAGHRWRREGIVPGILNGIYLDILTAFFGIGEFVILLGASYLYHSVYDYFVIAAVEAVAGAVGLVWGTIYLRELVLRMKRGKWWRHTLIYKLGRIFIRALQWLWKAYKRVLIHLPEIHLVVFVVAFLTLCEFVGIFAWGEMELFVCWFVEKLVVIPLILYCALAFQKLRRGSHALAKGDLSCKLDTSHLLFHFKEHGENLNQIGTGISKAVEERLQSERLKTELITNVSHDLKTPLTSVINYADLLTMAATGDGADKEAQIQEYAEVLQRQAKRLKKLLEDLVEASKAATGNLELQLIPCELGVMLTQAAGEYEEKFALKQLKLVMKKPEEEIRILADGRQLWRVFENLLNNICKYAQEGSRVYLNMEKKEDHVEVVFRNISKYELDVSPEELTERFVRGDASRHMEGSGLGLSIAKSLVDLQNGTMEIVTDGDLFKVIIRFIICK